MCEIKALKAYFYKTVGFIPTLQWLKQNSKNYCLVAGEVICLSKKVSLESQIPTVTPFKVKSVVQDFKKADTKKQIKKDRLTGIQTFLKTYKNQYKILTARFLKNLNRFLLLCQDLKVKRKKTSNFCVFWWDWKEKITVATGDYGTCFFKYEELSELIGRDPPKIKLPKLPLLKDYSADVLNNSKKPKYIQLELTLEV